jgi:hypothetical protein
MIEKRLLNASKRPTGRFGDFRCWDKTDITTEPVDVRYWE